MYSEERELDVETESKMTHEEKGSNKGQPQAEAVKDIESARGKEREDEELAAAGVTRSREVLEDDVLSWWNEALASRDSVLVTSQDSVLTVLELAGGEKRSLQTENRSGFNRNQLRDELQYASEKNQGDQSHKGSKEQKTEGREGSKTPTRDTIMKEGMDTETQETLEQTYGPRSRELLNPALYDWDTTNVTDSQLLSMLASKHCYQCTSTSTLDWTDYEEEEEMEERYNEEDYQQEMEEVVSASLHIPLYSPVRVRTVVQRGCKEEYTAPLSPLTLLSRRLAQRMKGSRSATISPPPTPDLSALEATWRQAAATQTSCTSSTATLRSPLLPPTRQQFSPRASTHFYTAPSSPILVTPVPQRRINEEQERKTREEEEAKQRAEEVRMRKLKKVLAKEEKERQVLARRRAEREEKEEADKLEAEQWRNVQCSPCTKCKGKQAGKTKGKQKIRKKEVKDDKGEKKPVIRDIFFGCFKAPSCMA